jgi:hypothetical protein
LTPEPFSDTILEIMIDGTDAMEEIKGFDVLQDHRDDFDGQGRNTDLESMDHIGHRDGGLWSDATSPFIIVIVIGVTLPTAGERNE